MKNAFKECKTANVQATKIDFVVNSTTLSDNEKADQLQQLRKNKIDYDNRPRNQKNAQVRGSSQSCSRSYLFV